MTGPNQDPTLSVGNRLPQPGALTRAADFLVSHGVRMFPTVPSPARHAVIGEDGQPRLHTAGDPHYHDTDAMQGDHQWPGFSPHQLGIE